MLSKETIQAYVDAGQMEVKVIADSISEAGKRITTFQLKYPRFIHSEVMTHRVFSRNASSSRAIPVKKMIEQVRNNPAMPIHWGANQSGMQAKEELKDKSIALYNWYWGANEAVHSAERLNLTGLHKQIVNRILEPFQQIHVVLTATEFDNFIELRYHEDAQPEIYALASLIKDQLETHKPKLLKVGEWHLPYITNSDKTNNNLDSLKKVSAARCCRVSYLNMSGEISSIEDDLKLCDRLIGSDPLHASPFEHQATPIFDARLAQLQANLNGWVQYRKILECKDLESVLYTR